MDFQSIYLTTLEFLSYTILLCKILFTRKRDSAQSANPYWNKNWHLKQYLLLQLYVLRRNHSAIPFVNA